MKFQELRLNSNFCNGMGFIIYSCMVSLTFFGCGATKTVKMNQAAVKKAYQIQEPFIVRTSKDDDRPEWTKNTMAEGEGKM